METATSPEVASGSSLKVKEARPADAERPQASPQQGAGSPVPQLPSTIEGDSRGLGRVERPGGGSWGGCSYHPDHLPRFLQS